MSWRSGAAMPPSAKFLGLKGDVGQVGLFNVSIDDERAAARPFSPSNDAVINLRRHPARKRLAAFRGDPPYRAGAAGADRARRRGRALYPVLGDRRRSALAFRLCPHQGGRRGGGARRVPDRDDPAPLGRVRPGGPVLQPLRRDGDDLAGIAADRRRRDAGSSRSMSAMLPRRSSAASTIRRPPAAPTSSAARRSIRCAQLIELLLAEIRRKRLLVNLPFGVAAMQARLCRCCPTRR